MKEKRDMDLIDGSTDLKLTRHYNPLLLNNIFCLKIYILFFLFLNYCVLNLLLVLGSTYHINLCFICLNPGFNVISKICKINCSISTGGLIQDIENSSKDTSEE